MALSQVGFAEVDGSVTASTAASVAVPASLLTNDIAIAVGFIINPGDTDAINAPAGYNPIPSAAFHMTAVSSAPNRWQISAWYKYVAGDSGNWVWSWTNSSNYAFCVDVIRGAPRQNPLDQISTAGTTSATTSAVWTGPTLGQANEYVVGAFANDNGFSYSAITNWTKRSAIIQMNLFDTNPASAGAMGNVTSTANNVCDQTATFISVFVTSTASEAGTGSFNDQAMKRGYY